MQPLHCWRLAPPSTRWQPKMHPAGEAAAESVVFTAINTTANGSLRLNKIAVAEFRPSHPTHASRHPLRTSTILWAGMAAGSRLDEYFPRRGPRIQAIDNALSPPIT